MSDIVFVCVSADMDLAETLADVFEAAGHAVGESEGDARAAIVIWSHAARRSSAFLQAAQRATDAGKAFVVSREGLSAGSVEGALVFDLTTWDGDANADAIDPLLQAVDRKLMLARADDAVGEMASNSAPPAAEFIPPRVRADFGAWKRPNMGNAARALAFTVVLLGGAVSASTFLGQREAPAPTERAPIASEIAFTQAPTETVAAHVTFTDAVSNDASFDDDAPPAPPPLGERRGREPPSVSSLSRRERATWRDAAYVSDTRAIVTSASYQAEGSAR